MKIINWIIKDLSCGISNKGAARAFKIGLLIGLLL